MRPCTTHHHACDCREQKVAVLIKCALDTATALDELKGAVRNLAPSLLSQHQFDNMQGMVERTYDACEQLGAEIGKPQDPVPCQHVICVADICAKCGAEVPA